jgi:hypothetical protein
MLEGLASVPGRQIGLRSATRRETAAVVTDGRLDLPLPAESIASRHLPEPAGDSTDVRGGQ